MILDKLIKVASNMSVDTETFVALGALLALVAPKYHPRSLLGRVSIGLRNSITLRRERYVTVPTQPQP